MTKEEIDLIQQYYIIIDDSVEYGNTYQFINRQGIHCLLQTRRPYTMLRGVKINGRRPDLIYVPSLFLKNDPEWHHKTLIYCVSTTGHIIPI